MEFGGGEILDARFEIFAVRVDAAESDFVTENEAEISFTRRGADVQITATYTPDTAVVPLPALVQSIDRFARRVVAELEQDYPDLAANAAARAITRPVLGALHRPGR